MKLLSPYKIGERNQQLQHLQFDVGKDDWNKVWRAFPEHGFQDRFLSKLFHRFYELSRDELPVTYDLESEQKLVSLIERLTLTRPVGEGRDPDVGQRVA